MKKLFPLLAFIFFASSAAKAQTMPTLLLDFNPESLGKASSTLATASVLDTKFSVNASYGLWQPKASGDRQFALNLSGNFGGRFAMGLDARMLRSEPYEQVSSQGKTTGTFEPKEFAAGLSGAFALTDAVSAGLRAKFVRSELAWNAVAKSFCGDVFLRYARKSLKVGLSVENLGAKAKYGEYEYPLPMIARAGAEYEIISGLNAGLEADYLFTGAFMAGAGVEYWIKDIVAPRIGFHYGPKDQGIPTYASTGLGVKFAGVHLNAAYLFANEILCNTFCVALGYSF